MIGINKDILRRSNLKAVRAGLGAGLHDDGDERQQTAL